MPLVFTCFFYLGPVCLFCGFLLCFFCIFSLVCFELSVPVQVIVKTRLRNELLCGERDVKLYSVTIDICCKNSVRGTLNETD